MDGKATPQMDRKVVGAKESNSEQQRSWTLTRAVTVILQVHICCIFSAVIVIVIVIVVVVVVVY